MTKRKRHNNPIAGGPVEPVMQPSPLPEITVIESETQPETIVKEKSKINSRKGNKGNKKVAVVEEVAVAPDEIQPGIDSNDVIIPVEPSPGIGNTSFTLKIDKDWFEPKEAWTTEDWDSFVDNEVCTMPDEQFNIHLENGLEAFLNRVSSQITFDGKFMTMIDIGKCPKCFTVKTLIAVTKKYCALKDSEKELAFIMTDPSEEGQEEDEQPKTIDQKIAELQESPWLAEAEARKLQQELAETPVQKIQSKTKWWNPFTWFGN